MAPRLPMLTAGLMDARRVCRRLRVFGLNSRLSSAPGSERRHACRRTDGPETLPMCGICGVVGRPDRDALGRMAAAMVHRGPDDDGFFLDEVAGLGFRRLTQLQ